MTRNFWIYVLIGAFILIAVFALIFYLLFPKNKNENLNQNRNRNVNYSYNVNSEIRSGFEKEEITTKTVIKKSKTTFEEGDTLTFNVKITSEENDYPGATLKVFGLESAFGEDVIQESREVALKKEQTRTERFSFKMPSCSSCSGVKEGRHTIYVNLIADNVLVGKAQFEIILRKK